MPAAKWLCDFGPKTLHVCWVSQDCEGRIFRDRCRRDRSMLQAACNTGVRGKICHEKTDNSNFISGLAFPVFRSNIEVFDFALDKQSPLGQLLLQNFMDTSIGQLRLVQSGDDQAWEDFSQRCRTVVVNWCRWHGISPDDADDIAQESLLVVISKVGRFQHAGRGTLRAWLKAIARRCWLEAVSNRSETHLEEMNFRTEDAVDEIARLEAEFESLFRRRVLNQAMQQVQARVQEVTWNAFLMTALQGHSAELASEKLQLSVSAVYSARARVQRMISIDFHRLYSAGEQTLVE